MAESGIKGYNIPLIYDKKIPEYDADKIKHEGVTALEFTTKTGSNELILAQEDMICFQIVKELRTKDNKYENTRQAWMKLSKKFDPTTEASKKITSKKLSGWKLYDTTINPK